MGNDRDLSSPIPWRRSLRAAQERRIALARRRRRALRGRAGLTLAVAGSALAAAGALAQDPSPPSDGTGTTTTASAPGGRVAAVQRALGLPADDVYGRRTRAAVRRFQRRHGLTVDGKLGPDTLSEMGVSDSTTADGSSPPASDPAAPRTTAASDTSNATLERIAQCESDGNPTAVSADGQYRGKYQFDRATWERIGGTGDPAAATEADQDRLAAKLLADRGTAPWPNCA